MGRLTKNKHRYLTYITGSIIGDGFVVSRQRFPPPPPVHYHPSPRTLPSHTQQYRGTRVNNTVAVFFLTLYISASTVYRQTSGTHIPLTKRKHIICKARV